MTIRITDRESPEFAGAIKLRFITVEIEDYDTSGEPLSKDRLGFNRIQRIDGTPLDGDVFSIGYDEDEEELHADIAEGENARLKLEVKGR